MKFLDYGMYFGPYGSKTKATKMTSQAEKVLQNAYDEMDTSGLFSAEQLEVILEELTAVCGTGYNGGFKNHLNTFNISGMFGDVKVVENWPALSTTMTERVTGVSAKQLVHDLNYHPQKFGHKGLMFMDANKWWIHYTAVMKLRREKLKQLEAKGYGE